MIRRALLPLLAAASVLSPATALAYGPSSPAVPYVPSMPFLAGGAFKQNMTAPSVSVDPNSGAFVSALVDLVNKSGAFVSDGYAGGDPICLTNASVPLTMMVGRYPQASTTLALQQGVPIPPGCLPDSAPDATMTVYDPTTHELWATWHTSTPAQNAPGCTAPLPWKAPCFGDGRWHFVGGGVIQNVTTSPGYYDYDSVPGQSTTAWGTSATSTINPARTVLASEVLAGNIPHAVAVASSTSLNCNGYDTWPAQRYDGTSLSPPPGCIPEGTFFRIPASVNLAALNLPPFTLLVAQAAQRYGLCLCESTPGGPTLQTENTTQYGYDAWTPAALLYGQTRSTAMRSFPWALLQAIAAPTRAPGVTQVASTTTSAAATGVAGSPVSVPVTVASADGRPVPGAVYLLDPSGNTVAAAMLSGSGGTASATLAVTPPAAGTYTYTVSYGGDQTLSPSSAPITVTAAGSTVTVGAAAPSHAGAVIKVTTHTVTRSAPAATRTGRHTSRPVTRAHHHRRARAHHHRAHARHRHARHHHRTAARAGHRRR